MKFTNGQQILQQIPNQQFRQGKVEDGSDIITGSNKESVQRPTQQAVNEEFVLNPYISSKKQKVSGIKPKFSGVYNGNTNYIKKLIAQANLSPKTQKKLKALDMPTTSAPPLPVQNPFWRNLSPGVEIYKSSEIAFGSQRNTYNQNTLPSKGFDHEKALGRSEGFDYTNVLGAEKQTLKPVGSNFNQGTAKFTQDAANYNQDTTNYKPVGSNYNQDSATFNHGGSAFNQVAQTDSTYNQPSHTFNQSPSTFTQTDSTYNQPSSAFTQTDTTFIQPSSTFKQTDSTYNQPSSTFHQTDSTYNKPASNFPQTDSTYKLASAFSQDTSNYNQDTLKYQIASFNEAVAKFNQDTPKYNQDVIQSNYNIDLAKSKYTQDAAASKLNQEIYNSKSVDFTKFASTASGFLKGEFDAQVSPTLKENLQVPPTNFANKLQTSPNSKVPKLPIDTSLLREPVLIDGSGNAPKDPKAIPIHFDTRLISSMGENLQNTYQDSSNQKNKIRYVQNNQGIYNGQYRGEFPSKLNFGNQYLQVDIGKQNYQKGYKFEDAVGQHSQNYHRYKTYGKSRPAEFGKVYQNFNNNKSLHRMPKPEVYPKRYASSSNGSKDFEMQTDLRPPPITLPKPSKPGVTYSVYK